MKKNIPRSIFAGVSGVLVGVFLSLSTDHYLTVRGVLPKDNLWVSDLLIVSVLAYRTLYNIIGSYIVALLAPHKPMKHVIIVGLIGTTVSIIGAITTRNMNLGPAWYAWTLALLTLPSSWLAGILFVRNKRHS